MIAQAQNPKSSQRIKGTPVLMARTVQHWHGNDSYELAAFIDFMNKIGHEVTSTTVLRRKWWSGRPTTVMFTTNLYNDELV